MMHGQKNIKLWNLSVT